jgi:flavorubredoxin
MITNPHSGTNAHEIADGIYRINTPVAIPGGPSFNFNQYLLVDGEPLLFHTGPRRMFPFVREAVAALMKPERLRWIGFSHTEADECGALNEWLAAAPQAEPLCSQVAAMVSIGDLADRPPRALADGERLVLGRHTEQWIDTPHVPHGWDAGLMFEETAGTLLCSDLLGQVGAGPALGGDDIVARAVEAEDMFESMPVTARSVATLRRLAALAPRTLAIMHGASHSGDGDRLLSRFADVLEARMARA